jgi:hypothetical protein
LTFETPYIFSFNTGNDTLEIHEKCPSPYKSLPIYFAIAGDTLYVNRSFPSELFGTRIIPYNYVKRSSYKWGKSFYAIPPEEQRTEFHNHMESFVTVEHVIRIFKHKKSVQEMVSWLQELQEEVASHLPKTPPRIDGLKEDTNHLPAPEPLFSESEASSNVHHATFLLDNPHTMVAHAGSHVKSFKFIHLQYCDGEVYARIKGVNRLLGVATGALTPELRNSPETATSMRRLTLPPYSVGNTTTIHEDGVELTAFLTFLIEQSNKTQREQYTETCQWVIDAYETFRASLPEDIAGRLPEYSVEHTDDDSASEEDATPVETAPPVSAPVSEAGDDASTAEKPSPPMSQVVKCDPEIVEPVAVSLAAAIDGISQACITATGKNVPPSAHERLAGLLSDAHSVMRMVRDL